MQSLPERSGQVGVVGGHRLVLQLRPRGGARGGDKRWAQDPRLAFARARRAEAPGPAARGDEAPLRPLAGARGRAGPGCLEWFTPEPEAVLGAFQRNWEQDRAGTAAFAAGLRRGLV